jgi:hypothetical protein
MQSADAHTLGGGKVWDNAPGCLQPGLAVRIRAGQLIDVCPPGPVAGRVQTIGVTGLSVIPVLIDAQVHGEDLHALLSPCIGGESSGIGGVTS